MDASPNLLLFSLLRKSTNYPDKNHEPLVLIPNGCSPTCVPLDQECREWAHIQGHLTSFSRTWWCRQGTGDLFSSVTQSCSTLRDPWTPAHQASLSITNSQSLLKLMSIKSVMPSNHLILCHLLLLLPSIFPSLRIFSNESALHIKWPKCQSFSFNISPSNEHPGLISFTMDWLDFLAVQGTLKSLLQHYSSQASIFWCSAFFRVQLSSILDYWENHSLD